VRFLARRPAAVGDAREAADCIVNDGSRAGEVIARIRALLSKQGPRHVVVDVNGIIGDVIHLLRATLDRQRVAVQTELATSLPAVMGDAVQLQQVLVNLVTNAVEAMSENRDRARAVTIRSEVDATGAVLVMVEDTGTGLDPQEIDRIFDSFYTTKPEGIGVGLSISRSIIEAHGGQLSAFPVLPHGARFAFALPAVEESSAKYPGSASAMTRQTRELARSGGR
jgi:signal transduction histidine kinase